MNERVVFVSICIVCVWLVLNEIIITFFAKSGHTCYYFNLCR